MEAAALLGGWRERLVLFSVEPIVVGSCCGGVRLGCTRRAEHHRDLTASAAGAAQSLRDTSFFRK